MLTFGSLFAGAGGMDLGLEAAGLVCRWQVEIDPRPRSVLARRWPAVPKHADVRAVGAAELPPVGVVAGGFPCQDLSVAGRRAGIQGGERSGLWWEMLRVIAELRPRFVLWENVPGLLSSDGGRDLRRVVSSLAEHGYFGLCRTLDAQHFGVPQRRRRVFGLFARGRAGDGDGGGLDWEASLAHSRRLVGLCAAVLAVPDGLPGNPAAGGEAGAGVAGPLTASTGNPGRAANAANGHLVAGTLSASGAGTARTGSGNKASPPVAAFGGNDTRGERRSDSSLSAKGGTGRLDFDTETFLVESAQCHGSNVGPVGTLRAGNCNEAGGVPLVAFNWQSGGDCRLGQTETTVPTLQGEQAPAVMFTEQGRGHATYQATDTASAMRTGGSGVYAGTVAIAENCRSEIRTSDIAPCLQTGGGKPGRGYPAALTESVVRRLTPVECERLQGWPDDHTKHDADGNVIADGPRYKMIGNGVAAPIASWIGRRLVAVAAAHPE